MLHSALVRHRTGQAGSGGGGGRPSVSGAAAQPRAGGRSRVRARWPVAAEVRRAVSGRVARALPGGFAPGHRLFRSLQSSLRGVLFPRKAETAGLESRRLRRLRRRGARAAGFGRPGSRAGGRVSGRLCLFAACIYFHFKDFLLVHVCGT